MSRKTPEEPREESLQDQAYDLLGEMLAERKAARYLQELAQEAAQGGDPEMEAYFARKDRENLRKIDLYTRRERRERLLRHTLPRMARAAAAVIAVVCLAGGVALAASPTVRVQVMKLLQRVEADYTTLRLVEDEGAALDVPAQWQGGSFPAYLPEGMELAQVLDGTYVLYWGVTDQTIRVSFSEYDASAVTNIDTEDATVRDVMIHGHPGYLTVKEEVVNIYWSDGLRYYIVTTSGIGEYETEKIAQNILRIK